MNHTIGVELAQQSLRAQIKYFEPFIFDAVFAVQLPHEKLRVALPANPFTAEFDERFETPSTNLGILQHYW